MFEERGRGQHTGTGTCIFFSDLLEAARVMQVPDGMLALAGKPACTYILQQRI